MGTDCKHGLEWLCILHSVFLCSYCSCKQFNLEGLLLSTTPLVSALLLETVRKREEGRREGKRREGGGEKGGDEERRIERWGKRGGTRKEGERGREVSKGQREGGSVKGGERWEGVGVRGVREKNGWGVGEWARDNGCWGTKKRERGVGRWRNITHYFFTLYRFGNP